MLFSVNSFKWEKIVKLQKFLVTEFDFTSFYFDEILVLNFKLKTIFVTLQRC